MASWRCPSTSTVSAVPGLLKSRSGNPNAITPLKIGNQVVPNQVVFSVLAFLFAWLAPLVGMTLLLTTNTRQDDRILRQKSTQQFRQAVLEMFTRNR